MENETMKHSAIGEEYVANILTQEEDLEHHGIKGQKWGRRRWQNEDGSLTSAGRIRYGQEINELEQRKEKLIDAREMAKHDPDVIMSSKKDRKIVDKLYNEKISDLDKEISSGKQKIQESLDKESVNRKTIRELAEKQLEESRKQAEKAAEERRKETEKREAEREKEEAAKKADKEKEEADKEAEQEKKETPAQRYTREAEEMRWQKTHEAYQKQFDPKEIAKRERDKQLQKEIDELSTQKNLITTGKNFTDSSKNIVDAIYQFKKADRMDMSKLSNQEMQAQIQRYQLETQYDNLFNTKRQEIEAGKARTTNIINTAGAALGVASSVLGIMIAMKQLKKSD